ncbi:hypothetical protein GGI21_001131, partial [Coemansia aciculifera]
MSVSDWETDSEYRQFRPGRYAMRQLGRSMSRRTKQLLPPHYENSDAGAGPESSGGVADYKRGPPLPSGIHRRSVSFDNLPIFPDSVRRSSTEPGMSTGPASPSIGLPAASTWNSGSAGTKSGNALQANGNSRQAWLAGLAHPLSTSIDSAQLAGVGGRHTGTRESFSGAAQLDASTHMSNSPRSAALDGSDPFQNRRLWISEEDLALEAQEVPAQAPQVKFQAVQIAPSAPVGSELLAGGPRKLGSIARVISTLSRKLHRMRPQRSASQPATPAEVRRSILDSARQNMIHVPNDPAHDFYRFFVNPADPVSDRESSAPDSPTISRHASSANTRRRHRHSHRTGPVAPAASASTSLPPVDPASPVFSNESLDRLYESISRAPSATPASSFSSHRRSASAGAPASSTRELRTFLTNQGHNGSVSELVLAKLASEFVDNVRVSTRLASALSPESSYGTFVRFHNSGELSGIFAAERAQAQAQAQEQQREQQQPTPTPMMQQGSASAEDLPQPKPAEPIPARYARNHDNVTRFVEEVRAVQQDSEQRKVDARGQQLVLNNSQALLDAALHIYERQQKKKAPRKKAPASRRRVTMFGMFCAPNISPSTSHASDILGSEPIAAEVAGATNGKSQPRRSQSLPRLDNSQQQQPFDSADGRWTQESLHVPWHRRSDQRQAERVSYPLQAQAVSANHHPRQNEPALDILQIHGIVRGPEQGTPVPPAAPRTRSGFLAGMLGILSKNTDDN